MPISFVAMPSVTERGEIDSSIVKPYSEASKGFTYFEERDVLFAKITPCMENGKGCVATGLANGIGGGSTEFHVLRPIPGVSNPYWLYCISIMPKFRNNARKVMTGTGGQLRVPISFIDGQPVTLPPIDLQNRFEEFYHETDKSKVVEQKAHKAAQLLFDSLMQKYFEIIRNRGVANLKQMHKSISCYITTSWVIYLITLAIATLLIVIGITYEETEYRLFKVSENLGYGIAGSLCVAILIDISNTKAKWKEDEKRASEILSPYKSAFMKLRDSVLDVAKNRFIVDGEKRTFFQWVDYAISNTTGEITDDEYWDLTFPFFHSVVNIEATASKLEDFLLEHMDNNTISYDYRRHISHIQSVSALIVYNWESEQWDVAVRTITHRLIPQFIKYNPELSKYFNESFAEDHWESYDD